MHDLVLRGPRVIDPASGLDAVRDVAFAGGKVAEVAPAIEDPAADARDLSGLIVTPGLIDLHTHVYWGATSISIDAADVAATGATATFVDAGSAGPGNFPGFRRLVIERSPYRILAFLNISFAGIFAYSRPVMVGECSDLRLLEPRECLRVIEANRDLIVGVKVRVGKRASGASGIAPVEIALDAAAEAGVPLMVHVDDPPPGRRDVLERLRPGDILTHCFRPFPNSAMRPDGEIWEEVLTARERGVVFDLGHGMASFGFETARAMLAQGFVPDVISSDVHALNVEGPVFDLLTTLSKFLSLGLDLATLIRTATAAPAAAIGRPDLGRLASGSPGDASVLAVEEGRFEFVDCLGQVMEGGRRLVSKGMVRAGKWCGPA